MSMLEDKKIICPCCGYSENSQNAERCEACGEPFFSTQEETKLLTSSRVNNSNPQQSKEKKKQINKTKQSNSSRANKWRKEILKPQNLSGIVVIIGSMYLLLNHFFVNGNNARAKVDKNYKLESVQNNGIKLVKAIKDVENVPNGIFSYSGDGYFASLLKYGLIKEIVTAFPNFESRYTNPTNQNPSYSIAIEMLARGEVDFVFNGRPLTPTEYAKAKLQNIQLQETAIARDGIVFYSHPELSVDKITIKELMGIWGGYITNWKQLGGEDLPITPVILSKENIESLGFEVGDTAKVHYASNHTLAVRKVIETPGAIGYASASLVQNQSLLKFLTLGKTSALNPDIVNYTPPFVGEGQPNKEAFEKGSYPLVRRLFLVISNRRMSQAAGTAMSNFLLSYQGQEIVDKAGFVSLRSRGK